MKIDRQPYADGTYDLALSRQYDIVQLKYDGWWCRLVVDYEGFRMYTRPSDKHPDGRLVKSGSTTPGFHGIFIGEYMFGTQWAQDPSRREKLFLFDAWKVGPVDLGLASYRDRYNALKTQAVYFPDWVSIVPLWHIGEFPNLWENMVATSLYEGVVFRRRIDNIEGLIIRQKRGHVDDFVVLGFEQGIGKHFGRLGALLCGTREKPTDIVCSVGNGFSDAEREEIWANPGRYKNLWFEAEGQGRFSSGLLRHPTFLKWRTEDGT